MNPQNVREKLVSEPKANILLVDDRAENLLALEAILADLGANLVIAHSGEEALRRALEREFAVVLLDVQMEGLDGFETAKLIRSQAKSGYTPIIFLTAYETDRLQLEQGYLLDAVDFLMKPLVPVILRAKVAGLVRLFEEKEHAQRQAEQYRLLIEGTKDHAILMLDPEGRVMSWNAGAERITGYQTEEIVGQHFSRFYPHESVERDWPAHELRVASSQGTYEDEGWRVRKDGSRYWANVVITALHDHAGNLRGFSKLTRDLTVRMQAEESARRLRERDEAAERLRRVVEATPTAMVMVDRQGIIGLVNSQTEKLFGYPREELLGRPVEILIPAQFRDHHPELRRLFFEAPQTRAMGTGRELFGLRKDGSEFPVEIGLNPIETPEGLFVLSAIVDITERQRLEERFRAAVESAPAAMVMIDAGGKIVLVNRETEKVFGYQRNELLGNQVEMLVPERFRSHHPQLRQGFFGQPASRRMGAGRDFYGLRKDGSEFPVEIGLNPIETPDGLFVLSAIVDITERRRLEERFRAALESAPAAMVMIDAGGKIVLVNREAEKLFGYQRNELLGNQVEMLVPERFRAQHPQLRQGFFGQPASRRIGAGRELFGLRKDGSEFPVEIGLNPIETPDGLFVLSAIVDITERQRLEERFRAAVESAPAAMVMIDCDGKIVLVNRETEKLFGYQRNELLGNQVEMLVPERFRPQHPHLRQGFFGQPASRRMGAGRELYGLHRDGGEFPVEIGLNPIETPEGLFVLSAIVDITERKRADEALKQSEERVRLIVDSSLDAAVTIDEQGKVTGWNPQAEHIFGWRRDEAIGCALADLVIPEVHRQQHVQGLRHFLATGEGPVLNKRLELKALRRTGEEFPVELNISPIRVGDHYEFSAFIRDITDRKQSEADLQFYASELEVRNSALLRSNQELDEFAYIASHDLKEPLRGIHNYAAFLIEDYADKLDEAGHDKLMTLQRLAQRLEELTDTLLQFSRVGRVELAMQATDLNEILGEVLESLRISLQERGAVVRHSNSLPVVLCDRVRVAEVFRNLVSNALKYNDKPEKWIEIGWRPDMSSQRDAQVPVFFVRDNGIGIPEKHFDAIFRIFKRLHGRDKYGGGTGAGLTIVKKIVERHGGCIWLESKPGEGSTFYFTLQAEDHHGNDALPSDPGRGR